jgi:hypothetical protein
MGHILMLRVRAGRELPSLARLAIFWYQKIMKASISDTKKKRGRGRPPTGIGRNVGLRLYADQEARIGDWIKSQQSPQPSVPEAIRHLIDLGLAAPSGSPKKILLIASEDTQTRNSKPSRKAAQRASDLAAEQVDKLTDQSLPPEERHARKRRLIKGPGEFRGLRRDLPKTK